MVVWDKIWKLLLLLNLVSLARWWRKESRMTASPSWKTASLPFLSPPPTANHSVDWGSPIYCSWFSYLLHSDLPCFWTLWPSHTISNVSTCGVGTVKYFLNTIFYWTLFKGGQGVVVAAGQASGRISFVTFRRLSQVQGEHVAIFFETRCCHFLQDFPVILYPLLLVRVVTAVDF